MNYWLIKSEPFKYSWDQFEKDKETFWDGVRNYQARNFLKSMEVGDLAFFYHSNTKPPGIVGLMKIIESQVIDPSQFDLDSDYYDRKSTQLAPRWHTVKLEFVRAFDRQIDLTELRDRFTPEELLVVRQGNRLSVMPILEDIADRILQIV